MTRRVRTWFFVTAAVLAAVIFFLLLALPPAPERLRVAAGSDLIRRTVAGAYHVHTTRSDGTADKASVAAAAGRAGLTFVIFTDHGDSTRAPDAPAYIGSVLCIDGVEISTDDGHYVALGMPASPYPLGGAGSAVSEDVARLGGFGILAHPDSPKASLQWRDSGSRSDGVEWLNADSEWRDERRGALARALLAYAVRPAAALASLLDRPEASLSRWDAMTRQRAVVGLAAHDAHGGVGGAVEDGEQGWVARVPSYEAAFASMTTRVIVDRPLTGEAGDDARSVLTALRSGRVFTTVDAIAAPAFLDFRVQSGGREFQMGEIASFAGPPTISARTTVPTGARTVLLRDGSMIAEAQGGSLEHRGEGAGVYRIEVRAPKAPGSPPVPWLVSNPIYLRGGDASGEVMAPARIVQDLAGLAWRVEHDPDSRAMLARHDEAIQLTYGLRAGERASQFVALVADLPPPLPPFDRIRVTGKASAPMRLSVQLRFGSGEARWGSSVYLDGTSRTIDVRVASMRLAGADQAVPTPSPTDATALLFVVDLTNTAPGTSGSFSLERPALADSR